MIIKNDFQLLSIMCFDVGCNNRWRTSMTRQKFSINRRNALRTIGSTAVALGLGTGAVSANGQNSSERANPGNENENRQSGIGFTTHYNVDRNDFVEWDGFVFSNKRDLILEQSPTQGGNETREYHMWRVDETGGSRTANFWVDPDRNVEPGVSVAIKNYHSGYSGVLDGDDHRETYKITFVESNTNGSCNIHDDERIGFTTQYNVDNGDILNWDAFVFSERREYTLKQASGCSDGQLQTYQSWRVYEVDGSRSGHFWVDSDRGIEPGSVVELKAHHDGYHGTVYDGDGSLHGSVPRETHRVTFAVSDTNESCSIHEDDNVGFTTQYNVDNGDILNWDTFEFDEKREYTLKQASGCSDGQVKTYQSWRVSEVDGSRNGHFWVDPDQNVQPGDTAELQEYADGYHGTVYDGDGSLHGSVPRKTYKITFSAESSSA